VISMRRKTIEQYYKKRKRFHDYIAGFVDGEASFTISIKKEPTTRFGYAIDPEFKVSQLKTNAIVLEFIRDAMNCGRIFEKSGQKNMDILVVRNRKHLVEKVIPFFRRHKLIVKEKEFEKFSTVVEALERKEHWTKEGFVKLLDKIFEDNPENRKYSLQDILRDMKK